MPFGRNSIYLLPLCWIFLFPLIFGNNLAEFLSSFEYLTLISRTLYSILLSGTLYSILLIVCFSDAIIWNNFFEVVDDLHLFPQGLYLCLQAKCNFKNTDFQFAHKNSFSVCLLGISTWMAAYVTPQNIHCLHLFFFHCLLNSILSGIVPIISIK